MNSEEVLYLLIESELIKDSVLTKLNRKILELENKFKVKHGNEVFHDYCEIAELAIEELLEYISFSFDTGRKIAL